MNMFDEPVFPQTGHRTDEKNLPHFPQKRAFWATSAPQFSQKNFACFLLDAIFITQSSQL